MAAQGVQGGDPLSTRVPVPEELAPQARELLLAFLEWGGDPAHEGILADDDWTMEQIVDLFILEASTRGND